MPTLTSQLQSLAQSFTQQVIAAIQAAPLNEIMASGGTSTANPRSARALGGGGMPDPLVITPAKRAAKPGRLPRRSAVEIAAMLSKIVLLVKTHKVGMRAEEIRSALGLQAKEMPRILKEGLAKKKLTRKGQKRATTYLARG
jgi:hypothetical protein